MNSRKFALLLSIVGIVIATATGIATVIYPEFRCFLRLQCPLVLPPNFNFQLLIVTEESKPIEGVEVFFIMPDDKPPEIKRTNSDGYVQIKLPSKGDIEVKLSKEGYETLTRTVNLDIEIEPRTRTYRLKKSSIVTLPSIDPTDPKNPTDSPSTGTTTPTEKKCERTRGNTPEDYYGEILVNRTFKKPDRRISLSTANPYSVVCKIITNTGSLNFIYAIPDGSDLKKVKISLYLDGKLSKSVEVTRGSLVPLSVDTRNISNYSIDYIVEDDETNPSGNLYMFTTSN